MTPRPGTHTLGPDGARLVVRTYREGVGQKIGHDLILELERWQGTVEVDDERAVSAAGLEADSGSLQVREGLHGVKSLSDRDRAEIRRNIQQKILLGRPIAFESTAVEHEGGRLSVTGELTMAGSTRTATFELELEADGRLRATLPVSQTHWGIKPYRGFMGALRVRDTVEVVLDARLPMD
jgi:polyisoprenoid-binding protein YceI